MLPTIADGHVTLRPWRTSDAELLHQAMQDADTVRWMAIDLPYTLEDARGFIEGTGPAWEQRKAAHFAIAGADDGLIGYLGALSVEDRMSVVELGYWVAPEARGRGVATRAVQLVVSWALDALRPRRIEIGMLAGNQASRRVAESAGFVLERTEPSEKLLDGQAAEEWIFALPSPANGQNWPSPTG